MSPQGGRTEAPQAATPAPAAPAAPARTTGTPHHPSLVSDGDAPVIPAGENRMGLDLLDYADPRDGGDGRSTGFMYLPGYASDAYGEPYVYQERPGGPWHVNSLPGGVPEQQARTPQELMAKVARLFGISGQMKIEDEREGTRTSHTGTTTVEPRAKRAAPDATGPGAVPVGGTDADRQAARPRKEGESDRAYAVRTAPSRDAALRMLNGHQAAGLRAIAREEGVVTSGSKADLVARLIRVMRDRHEDGEAIERMVNRDRTPEPAAATPTPVRAVDRLRAIPEAGGRLGREPVADTVDRILTDVQDGRMSKDRAAQLIAQLVQRFSINRGGSNAQANEQISAILAEIAGSLRATPPPTMTGSQLLAQRRARG